MRNRSIGLGLLIGLLSIHAVSLFCEEETARPITPNVSAEAAKLLDFIYSISGKQTLVGQPQLNYCIKIG
jgi:hypothetical protein